MPISERVAGEVYAKAWDTIDALRELQQYTGSLSDEEQSVLATLEWLFDDGPHPIDGSIERWTELQAEEYDAVYGPHGFREEAIYY